MPHTPKHESTSCPAIGERHRMKSYPRPPDIREYDTREGWALDAALARHRWERRRVWKARALGFGIGALIAMGLAAAAHGSPIYVRDTGSMKGWIHPGGSVYDLEACPLASVKVGDVIVWRHPRAGLVCHRVIEIHAAGNGRPAKVWTRGDSNKAPDDEWVTPENFRGRIRQ